MAGKGDNPLYEFYELGKVEDRGSVVIPIEVRKALKIEKGDTMIFFVQSIKKEKDKKRVIFIKLDDIMDEKSVKEISE